MSVPNCEGCKEELEEIKECSKQGLHFAGQGLYEKGHLIMIMVNEKGEVMVG